jgi:hypothetical protein
VLQQRQIFVFGCRYDFIEENSRFIATYSKALFGQPPEQPVDVIKKINNYS